MLTLKLTISERGSNYRKGDLVIDSRWICKTLELVDGWIYQTDHIVEIEAAKKSLKCAIPYGTYAIKMIYSSKFKRLVPTLMNVPGWSSIEIHGGNTHTDSEGCILIGLLDQRNRDLIYNCNCAAVLLMTYLNGAKDGEMEIVISEGKLLNSLK